MSVDDLKKLLKHLEETSINPEDYDFAPTYWIATEQRKDLKKLLRKEIKNKRMCNSTAE